MTDRTTIRLVVGFLGFVAIATVAGGFYLTAIDKQIPDALIAIGSSSVGAVAALLARTSSGDASEVVPTQIVNTAASPVPVAPAEEIGEGHDLTAEDLAAIEAIEPAKVAKGKR